MEISPVSGLRDLPAAKPVASRLGVAAVFEVEPEAKIGNATHAPSSVKPPRGLEDGKSDDDLEEEDEGEPGYTMRATRSRTGSKVDYYA